MNPSEMNEPRYRIIHPGRVSDALGKDLCGEEELVARLNDAADKLSEDWRGMYMIAIKREQELEKQLKRIQELASNSGEKFHRYFPVTYSPQIMIGPAPDGLGFVASAIIDSPRTDGKGEYVRAADARHLIDLLYARFVESAHGEILHKLEIAANQIQVSDLTAAGWVEDASALILEQEETIKDLRDLLLKAASQDCCKLCGRTMDGYIRG